MEAKYLQVGLPWVRGRVEHTKGKLMRAGPGEDWVKCTEEQRALWKPPEALSAEELGIGFQQGREMGRGQNSEQNIAQEFWQNREKHSPQGTGLNLAEGLSVLSAPSGYQGNQPQL